MSDSLDPLIHDLVEWVARRPRTYQEMLEAWRTSCPRLTVWEDASERGLIERRHGAGGMTSVVVTQAGVAFLEGKRVAGSAKSRGPGRAATALQA